MSRLSWDEAVAIINNNGDVSKLNHLAFDINHVDEFQNFIRDHESNNFENNWFDKVKQTLFHVAIKANHLEAVKILLQNGANKDLPYITVTIRAQRCLISGSVHNYAAAEWSDWKRWVEKSEKRACQDLTTNTDILQLLK
ncbi:hypothetical protein FDP41_012432 [Naegleria fowleri]|uniref:Uncharacterized protein n=1 Tax=Naegleria fowleri TaxID=5763 RepID=A0A6A5C8S1_NAEFO|nr:uncharacterized protein FDP41_012432 [Naegleria fowleri]KAF0981775.1 hypothetical protein FDP41_012432 [Naegleria fowleri]